MEKRYPIRQRFGQNPYLISRYKRQKAMMNRLVLGLVVILAVFSCKDSFDNFDPDPDVPIDPPLEMAFDASAFVEVLDSDGTPVDGAIIALGTLQQTTDEYGVVHLDEVTMSTNTYLTVEKSGYFHGSRRFYPTEGRTHHVKIILLEDNSVGEVDSDVGGTISATGGVTLDFPANSVVTAGGEAYHGFVSVAVQPITANDPNLSGKMPGDLVGVTEEGTTGALASMGMMAVELRSLSGDLLQVKDGSTVKMTMQVPVGMQGNAPATIPMWYFDEEVGLWKEEGTATLSAGEYTANVAHFSYWNYDAWFPIVKLAASFVYESGPAANVSVCITILALDTRKCALTNDEGVVCGMVAADELLLMEVMDPCGNVVFSQEIGPFSDSTSVGPYTIAESAVTLTTVTGSAVDCDENPVTNGFARIKVGQGNHYVELDENDGTFELTVMNCDESDVMITVIDESALKQSLPQSYDYASTIDAGEIMVCETLMELIVLDVEGEDDDFLFFFPRANVDAGKTFINTQQDSSGSGGYFYLSFAGDEPGTYEASGMEIGLTLDGGEFVWATEATVIITYFGDVGDYVVGTISGILTDNPQGGGTEYNFTGTISTLRE